MNDHPHVMTRVLHVDPHHPAPEVIAEAAAVLRRGGTVAFPTETVYGLGANALDAAAVSCVFAAKGRPAHDPLIVHVASAADLPSVARVVPEQAQRLAARFWPGPLSLVLPKQPQVPDIVTAGLDTVAVRVPAYPVARALIQTAGLPVAAPSANRFGHTSPTTAEHVLDDLAGRIDLVLDGGPTEVGVESTVLDLSGPRPVLLRPGGVTVEQLREIIGDIVVGAPHGKARAAASPGLLASHYAPRAELRVFAGEGSAALNAMRAAALATAAAGKLPGLLVTDDDAEALRDLDRIARVERLGPVDDASAQARRLFAAMRRLDAAGVAVMLARLPQETGLGRAVADRLRRAAGGKVEWVGAD